MSNAKELQLRNELRALRSVQAGWAFGVPEDARDIWLELIVKTVMSVMDSSSTEVSVPCCTTYESIDRKTRIYDMVTFGHARHTCALPRPVMGPHMGSHTCSCTLSWPGIDLGIRRI